MSKKQMIQSRLGFRILRDLPLQRRLADADQPSRRSSRNLYCVEVSPKRASDEAALAAFLPYVEVMDFSDAAARHYAEIRADLKKRGALIGANDLFIAAHARSLGLTLITNNTAEFTRVKGLVIENWTVAGRRTRSATDK